MSCPFFGDGPQPEKYLASSVAIRAVLERDREVIEAGGRDPLQPHGSREQAHQLTDVDNLNGSIRVS